MRAYFGAVLGFWLSLSVVPACSQSGGGTEAAMAPPPPFMEGWGSATPVGGGGLLTYAFTVDPAALERMRATALQEQWVPAELNVSGMAIGPVGLRYKGEETLKACFEGGVQSCAKPSLKVKFDYPDPAKRLTGLKRLHFNGMLGDQSLLRERLAAEIYQRVGVPGPRVSHAWVTINGEVKGLFAAVEALDGRFTKDRWKEAGDGNLYKEAWPLDVQPDTYSPRLQTNEAISDNRRIVELATALFGAKSPPELAAAIATFVDVPHMLRFLAVDRAINNHDGISAFYCNVQGQECSNRNYYWYQHQATNQFLPVPWDLTETFDLRTPFDRVPGWEVKPADCGQRIILDEGTPVQPPGCELLFQGLAAHGGAAWQAALDQVLAAWNVAQLHQKLDQWVAEIEPGARRDPFGPPTQAWRSGVEALKLNVSALRERLDAIRNDRPLEPFGIVRGLNDFEAVTDLTFGLGSSSESNSATGAILALGTSGALGGSKDVRFAFQFTNETTGDPNAAGPFASFRIAIKPAGAGAAATLQGLSRIRFRATSDSIRAVRVDIDSPRYGNASFEEIVRYGWDIGTVARTPAEFVLDIGRLNQSAASGAKITLEEALTTATALIFTPQPRGRNEAGLLPPGRVDAGFIRLDDLVVE